MVGDILKLAYGFYVVLENLGYMLSVSHRAKQKLCNCILCFDVVVSLYWCISSPNICLFYLMFQKRLNVYLFKHLFPSNFRSASVNFFSPFFFINSIVLARRCVCYKFQTKLRFWVRCISYFDFVFNLEDCYPQFTHMHWKLLTFWSMNQLHFDQ